MEEKQILSKRKDSKLTLLYIDLLEKIEQYFTHSRNKRLGNIYLEFKIPTMIYLLMNL